MLNSWAPGISEAQGACAWTNTVAVALVCKWAQAHPTLKLLREWGHRPTVANNDAVDDDDDENYLDDYGIWQ